MKATLLIVVVAVAGCANHPLPNSQTASERFSTLGGGERRIAREFYDFGSGDAIKRLFWAQRRMQEQVHGDTSDAQPTR